MSDLSELFKSPLPATSSPVRPTLSAASAPTALSSPAPQRFEWQLSTLEASLRKGVRREVGAESMREELRVFFGLQKEALTRRLMVIAAVTVLLWIGSDISGSVLFTVALLVGSELLTTLALPFSEPVLNANIRRVQPLIYCVLFYSLLKWATNAPTQRIDWPTTFIALVATLARVVLSFYDSFLLISSRAIIAAAVTQKKALGKLMLFPKYVIYRVVALLAMGRHLILAASLLTLAAAAIFYAFNKLTLDCFQPSALILALPIFAGLQLFMDFVGFVNLAFSQEAPLSKVMRDKMPVYLSLLRLEFTPANRLVQLECLKSLYVRLDQDSAFLTTETYKSLLYSTYMDLFNQFAAAELERALATLTSFVLKARLNDKTLAMQKSPLQDLLVYFRKASALLSSEWQAAGVSDLLGSLSFLLLIVQKVEAEGAQQDVRVSRRVVSLLRGIRQRLGECVQRRSLCGFTRGELMGVYHSWSREEFFVGSES